MHISVVGSGYVGLVTAACLADTGNDVRAMDNNAEKVAALQDGHCPIFEPGLEEMVRANLAAGRLHFTTDLAAGIDGAQVVFSAVGTPPRPDGSADLSAVEAVAIGVARALSGPVIFVNKSTVPVGTGRRVAALLAEHSRHACRVVSNPEFLKEGSALEDFLRPDRVVIGADDRAASATIAELYEPFVRANHPILTMSLESAEMCKYAANAYLSTRISFVNEIAEICERLSIDINEVRRGIGFDARIGHHFLAPGIGYGGSCFPKDVQALASTGRQAGADCTLLDAVHRRNLRQRSLMIERIRQRLGPDLHGRRLAVWGLAFKPQTDDTREAPAMDVIAALLAAGARVAAYDPQAIGNAKAVFGPKIEYGAQAYDVLKGADALVILTEWNEFRNPDFQQVHTALRRPLIFDGRNLYELDVMRRYGFEYVSVGRPAVPRS
jgi:UDPglucose 6-dehydrogenase